MLKLAFLTAPLLAFAAFTYLHAQVAAPAPASSHSPEGNACDKKARGKIVALDIDIAIDQVSPEEAGMRVGQHHEARIYYDISQVDPKTHRVPVIHEQHTPMLIPKHLDPLAEPMSNAWLDMSGPVYRYHYAASPVKGPFPFAYAILFDEQTMRMTIRKQSDGTVLLAGPYTVNTKPITGPDIDAVVASSEPVKMPWVEEPPMMGSYPGRGGHGGPPAGEPSGTAAKMPPPAMATSGSLAGIPEGAEAMMNTEAPTGPNQVILAVDVELDQVAEEDSDMYRVGGHDLDRIGYDKSKIDPITHKVPINYLAHYIGGHWAATKPTEVSSLDLSKTPYRLEFVTSVDHGRPILVVFDEEDRRMAIISRPDFRMLIAGKYVIASAPLTTDQIAAPPPGADSPDTMPMLHKGGLPGIPPSAGGSPPHTPGSAPGPLTTNSTYGDLLANPAAKAILVELIPEVVNNSNSQMGLGIPLRSLSQFEPTLTPEKLKQIDDRLLKLASTSK